LAAGLSHPRTSTDPETLAALERLASRIRRETILRLDRRLEQACAQDNEVWVRLALRCKSRHVQRPTEVTTEERV
jgi:hypothetical protein